MRTVNPVAFAISAARPGVLMSARSRSKISLMSSHSHNIVNESSGLFTEYRRCVPRPSGYAHVMAKIPHVLRVFSDNLNIYMDHHRKEGRMELASALQISKRVKRMSKGAAPPIQGTSSVRWPVTMTDCGAEKIGIANSLGRSEA